MEYSQYDCFGVIYKITNKTNGKMYIGATTKSIVDRWHQHILDAKKRPIMKISKAIVEYGENSFDIHEIDWCDNLDDMNFKERYWIKELKSCETGYNSAKGGNNQGPPSIETIEKIKAKQKAFWSSPKSNEARKRLREIDKERTEKLRAEKKL